MKENIFYGIGCLPPVHQLGFVVKDLDLVLPFFSSLFGSLKVVEYQLKGVNYRGKPSDCKLKVAFANAGSVEIELIQLLAGDSPHQEFLLTERQGIHHIGFKIKDIDTNIIELGKHGYSSIWYHRLSDGTAFSYLEHHSNRDFLLELIELPDS